MAFEPDYIVVGAGAGGGVLASRLAEDGKQKVLLIEAGPDHHENRWVRTAQNYPFLWDIHFLGIGGGPARSPSHWRFKTESQNGKVYCYPRGTGLGGSVSHHATIDGRGLPSIYNEWAEFTGDSTWRYENLEPVFKAMENYTVPGANESIHGKGGWLNIRHGELEPGFHEPFIQAATTTLDVPFRKDLYDDPENRCGVYKTDYQVHPDGRRSYVAPDLILPTLQITKERGWHNFQIATDQLVTKVIVEEGRAVGVEVIDAPRAYGVDAMHKKKSARGPRKVYRANKEIIVCGGSINTPQLLMLSGIGPADHLRSLGIDVVADLPGVGSGLQDHQDATLVYRLHNLPNKAWRWQILRASKVNPLWKRRADPDAIGEGLSTLNIDFHSGFEANLPSEPDIHAMCPLAAFRDYNISVTHFRDKDPLKASYPKLVANAFNQLKPIPYQTFLIETLRSQQDTGSIRLKSTDPTHQPLIDTHAGKNDDGVTRLAMAVQKLREMMATPEMQAFQPEEILPGPQRQSLEETKHYIKHYTMFGHHMTSTCRMGPDGDPMRVVDTDLRVQGVEGLRICDASIFPTTPGYNTSRPCYLVGEILAAKMRGGE